jgi:hypothetical protein
MGLRISANLEAFACIYPIPNIGNRRKLNARLPAIEIMKAQIVNPMHIILVLLMTFTTILASDVNGTQERAVGDTVLPTSGKKVLLVFGDEEISSAPEWNPLEERDVQLSPKQAIQCAKNALQKQLGKEWFFQEPVIVTLQPVKYQVAGNVFQLGNYSYFVDFGVVPARDGKPIENAVQTRISVIVLLDGKVARYLPSND